MRSHRLLVAFPLLVAAACGSARGTTTRVEHPGASRPGEVALLATETGLTAVDAGTTRLRWHREGAVAALDGSAVFARGSGTLVRLDPRTGDEVGSWPIDAALNPAVVAPDGRWVALTDRRPDYVADPAATHTRLVVVDGASGAPRERLDLVGDVEPEAFTVDGQGLIVLDHRGSIYRVQRLELSTGERYDTIDEDKNPVGDMTGQRVRGVLSSDRSLLATLYRNPANADEPAFVHVLDLNGWTFCVDLPAPFGTGPDGNERIERTPDDAIVVTSEHPAVRARFDLAELRERGSKQVQVAVTPFAGPRADAAYLSIAGYRALIAVLATKD